MISSQKYSTDSKTTIYLYENMQPYASEKSQNKTSILPNWFATLEELLPSLTSSQKPKEKRYQASLHLDTFQPLIKLWLWESFKLKVSTPLEMPSKTKMKVSEPQQHGVLAKWEDIPPTTPKPLQNKTYLDFYLNYTKKVKVLKNWKKKQRRLWKVSSKCVPTSAP